MFKDVCIFFVCCCTRCVSRKLRFYLSMLGFCEVRVAIVLGGATYQGAGPFVGCNVTTGCG